MGSIYLDNVARGVISALLFIFVCVGVSSCVVFVDMVFLASTAWYEATVVERVHAKDSTSTHIYHAAISGGKVVPITIVSDKPARYYVVVSTGEQLATVEVPAVDWRLYNAGDKVYVRERRGLLAVWHTQAYLAEDADAQVR